MPRFLGLSKIFHPQLKPPRWTASTWTRVSIATATSTSSTFDRRRYLRTACTRSSTARDRSFSSSSSATLSKARRSRNRSCMFLSPPVRSAAAMPSAIEASPIVHVIENSGSRAKHERIRHRQCDTRRWASIRTSSMRPGILLISASKCGFTSTQRSNCHLASSWGNSFHHGQSRSAGEVTLHLSLQLRGADMAQRTALINEALRNGSRQ
jgi:hypothetical protein